MRRKNLWSGNLPAEAGGDAPALLQPSLGIRYEALNSIGILDKTTEKHESARAEALIGPMHVPTTSITSHAAGPQTDNAHPNGGAS